MYKPEHLPRFSNIEYDDRSIIHVQLGDIHIIEGSYNCYLWIYHKLDSSAVVFDYTKNSVPYRDLTQGLQEKMERKGIIHTENITHNSTNVSWQNKAIKALNKLRIGIAPQDVLSDEDAMKYKRRYGVYRGD